MATDAKAYIVGAFEHPERRISNKTIQQVLAEIAYGAIADAGLSLADVDGYVTSAEVPGFGNTAMADYLGLVSLRYIETTETGGSSYLVHLSHASRAIAEGKASVVLITMGGLPLSVPMPSVRLPPEGPFEDGFGWDIPSTYALAARRHMYEFGTTSADLAEVKVAAAHHAQYNPNAVLRKPVTVDDVLESPMIADPLHRLDCCITTDGGGAIVVVSEPIYRSLGRRAVKLLGSGEAMKHTMLGRPDLSFSGAALSAPRAFEEAGLKPAQMDYLSCYDSFTITVMISLEDMGFCEKGEGGKFVRDGTLQAPFGRAAVQH